MLLVYERRELSGKQRDFARAVCEGFGVVKGKGGICAICTHPKRREIDIGLTCRTPVSVLSARFGISVDSCYRHREKHLTAVQRAAILASMAPSALDLEQLQRSESESLLAQLLAQRATLQQYSGAAFEKGNLQAAISAERGVVDNLALVSKLLGMLVTRHEVTHASLLISPDYITLRQSLIAALKPYPEAGRAVANALHRLESAAAETIREAAAKGNGKLIEHQAEEVPL
jgi:hypothetical protein